MVVQAAPNHGNGLPNGDAIHITYGKSTDNFESPALPKRFSQDETPPPHLSDVHHGRRASEITDALEPAASVGDAESLVAISQPPSENEAVGAPVYAPLSLPVLASLMPTSIFGVLARLGLLALTTYDGHSTFPLAWVQAAGCLVMGFALGLKEPIGNYYSPLYTAIATGFCGSVTTFSSWQFDIFSSWANTTSSHRDWLRDVVDGLGKTVFTLAISLSAVNLGLHLSKPVARRMPKLRPPSALTSRAVVVVCIVTYAATLPAYFLLSHDFRHQATAALLFSFPGTLTRYILAVKLTPVLKLFPLGTFVANTSGTALLGMFHVLQRTPSLPGQNACAILQGLMDGYCGCLTTVSTFAVEVGVLRRRQAWLYVGLSWGVSQLLLLVILGPSWLRGGIKENVVCAFA